MHSRTCHAVLFALFLSSVSGAADRGPEFSLSPEIKAAIQNGTVLPNSEPKERLRREREDLIRSLGAHWSGVDLISLDHLLEQGDQAGVLSSIQKATGKNFRPNADLVMLVELLHADAFSCRRDALKKVTQTLLSEEKPGAERIASRSNRNRAFLRAVLYERVLLDADSAEASYALIVKSPLKAKLLEENSPDGNEELAASQALERIEQERKQGGHRK